MDEQRRQMLAQALLGQGMAAQAGNNIQTNIPNYRDYAIEAQTRGLQAVPPNGNWMEHMKQLQLGGG